MGSGRKEEESKSICRESRGRERERKRGEEGWMDGWSVWPPASFLM